MRTYSIDDLIYLMGRLRDPETGCPWDLEQSFATIVPHTLEEVYEVVDTIEREDYVHLKEELGDLLFQVIFYAQLGNESGLFSFNDIADAIVRKLLVRHPHVFPGGTLDSKRDNAEVILQQSIKDNWESTKQNERDAKGKSGLLDDVPLALPALNRAAKLQKRASSVGFDWQVTEQVLDKVEEEITELKEAVSTGCAEHMEEELGDLLFSVVNLSRHLQVSPETSLRKATQKFEQRFRFVEQALQKQQIPWGETGPEEMEILWQKAKQSGL